MNNMTAFRRCKNILDQPNPSIPQFNHHLKQVNAQDDFNILLKSLIVKKDMKIENFIPIFDALMRKGANINWTETKQNKSLIMIACAESTAAVVKQMLKYQLKIEEKDKNNKNCLFYALENKSKSEVYPIMSLILSKYPQMTNSQASNKNSIIYSAVQKQKLQIVKLLLQKGANPNTAISDTMDTPLHFAMKQLKKGQRNQKNYKPIIRQLLLHKADYNLKNKQDKTAVQIQPKFKQYLLKQIEQVKNMEKKKQIPTLYKINTSSQISNLISEADKYYNQWHNKKVLEKENNQVLQKKNNSKNVKPLTNIPFQSLFIASEELQHYLQCSIKEYQRQIEIEGEIDRKLAQQLRSQIQIECKKLKVNIFIFGSYATKLNMKYSDVNLAVSCESNEKQLLNNLIDTLKNIWFVQDVKIIDDYFLKIICKDKFKEKSINMTLINPENLYLQKSMDMIKIYLETYPEIKVLLYILKNLIYGSELLEIYKLSSYPYNSYAVNTYAFNNFGLFILIAAYVQNQYHYKVPENTQNTAKLLINFLKYFGYDHDYMLKGIYLAEIQNKYQYKEFLFTKYFNDAKLHIMNPLFANEDVGATHNATKLIQDIFKVAYVTIHINYDCHKKDCKSREKITALMLGKYQNSYRPCCILERLFRCHRLVKHQPYYPIV